MAQGSFPGAWVPLWPSDWNVAVRWTGRELILWPWSLQLPQLHSRLLVLPLDHLVMLSVLQVGSQLCVLSLLSPLPGSVTLDWGQLPSVQGPQA